MILTVLWCVMIFCFSAMEGDESTATSYWVGERICNTFVPQYHSWDSALQMDLVMDIDIFVRKGAHMMEYMILSMFVFGTVLPVKKETRAKKEIVKTAFVAFALAVCYAASDEFHQYFVPGRAAMVTDVLIDSGGVLIGVFICAMGMGKARKRQK